ncbi:MAG: SIR2 family protein [Chloroflexi bacterium]|nr:SIR2 family protein [Chloroflexota bacterium]
MPDVFILGAGFSKAVCGSMPTLEELSTKVRKKLAAQGKLPPVLLGLGDNIELWLTYLSQPQPWLKEYENLQNKALFLRMIEAIAGVLDAATREVVAQACPDWLQELIKWWDKNRSAVITFNYDTLIERAAFKAGIEEMDLYPVLFNSMQREAMWDNSRKGTLRLFKLHGSVSWFYSGAESFYGESIENPSLPAWGDSKTESEYEAGLAASDKIRLIAPPTTEKATYFRHESLRQIWRMASGSLRNATCVYSIGYSLPLTDLGIRFFLQQSGPDPKIPVFVVNRNDQLVGHYEDLLGKSYAIDGKYAGAGVEAMVNDLCK